MSGIRIDNNLGKIFFNDLPFLSGDIKLINHDNQPVMTNNDFIYIAATGLGNAVLSLPLLADARGSIFIFKKSTSDANTFTINAQNSEFIDGASSYVIPGGSKGTMCCVAPKTGTNWYILFSS